MDLVEPDVSGTLEDLQHDRLVNGRGLTTGHGFVNGTGLTSVSGARPARGTTGEGPPASSGLPNDVIGLGQGPLGARTAQINGLATMNASSKGTGHHRWTPPWRRRRSLRAMRAMAARPVPGETEVLRDLDKDGTSQTI